MKSIIVVPNTKKICSALKKGMKLVTSASKKGKAFKNVIRKRLKYAKRKSCLNLKFKTLKKHCDLKAKYIPLKKVPQNNIKLHDCMVRNPSTISANQVLNDPKNYKHLPAVSKSQIMKKKIGSELTSHYINKTSICHPSTVTNENEISTNVNVFPHILSETLAENIEGTQLENSTLGQARDLGTLLNLSSECMGSSSVVSGSLADTNLNDSEMILKSLEVKEHLMEKVEPKSKEGQSINNCLSDYSSSDDENGNHPNRRLQIERSKNGTTDTLTPSNIKKRSQNTMRNKKASELWINVLNNPDPWTNERVSCQTKVNTTEHNSNTNYRGLLVNFVNSGLKKKHFYGRETLYERRFREKFQDKDFRHIISEFYIPPAQVEVFHQTLTDSITAQECLKQICIDRKWPEPEYTQKACSGGFLASCKLKTKKFTPIKTSSNEHLSRELAASECLDWLGLTQRKVTDISDSFDVNTYFG